MLDEDTNYFQGVNT